MVIVSTLKCFAIFGISGAKLKNAAFPEPIKKAQIASKIETAIIIAKTPNPAFLQNSIKVSTKPTDKRPFANT